MIRGCGLRNAQPPPRPIDVGNAGTLMRLLPGWLAFQQGASFKLDGDESIRRRPVDRIAEPLRADGRRGSRPATGGSRRSRCTAPRCSGIEYELPVASAQVKSCVLLAGPGDRTRRPWSSPCRRATTPSGCCCAPAPRSSREAQPGGGMRTTVGNVDELELADDRRPRATSSSAAFLIAAGVLVRRLASWCSRRSASTGRVRGSCGSSSGWARSCSADIEPRGVVRAGRAGRRPGRPGRAARGHDRRGRRGAAGDRRAAAGGAARLLCRGGDGGPRRRRAAREGVRPDRHRRRRPARARRRHRGDARRVRGAGRRAACAAARSTPTATTGWRCWARSPGWRRGRGWRSSGWRRRRCPTRASRDDLGRLLRMTIVAIDGPAGAGKSTRRARRRRRAGVHLPGLRARCTAPSRWRRSQRACRRPRSRRSCTSSSGSGCCLTAATSAPTIRTAEVVRGAPRGRPPTPRCARRWSPSSAGCCPRGDWVAEGRDIGTVVAPRRRRQGVPDRRPGGTRPPPRGRARRRPRRAVLAEQTIRDERDRTREHSPLARADGRGRARHAPG